MESRGVLEQVPAIQKTNKIIIDVQQSPRSQPGSYEDSHEPRVGTQQTTAKKAGGRYPNLVDIVLRSQYKHSEEEGSI